MMRSTWPSSTNSVKTNRQGRVWRRLQGIARQISQQGKGRLKSRETAGAGGVAVERSVPRKHNRAVCRLRDECGAVHDLRLLRAGARSLHQITEPVTLLDIKRQSSPLGPVVVRLEILTRQFNRPSRSQNGEYTGQNDQSSKYRQFIAVHRQNHRLWISRKTECRYNERATRVLGAVLRDAGLHGARDSAQTELFPQLRYLESWTDHLRGNYGQVCV